ncbi:MAG TPA: flagellar hook-associated protein FlgL [Terriglobales bacterium]|nr:flagellar hook-associated protein FlgL [Terriglobales bacterium]
MSSIRVNPYPMPDILDALEKLQQQQDTATLELSTGSTINKPSDNPAGAAEQVMVQESSSLNDTYQQSISSITGQLSTAQSTLSSVVTALQRAISLGTEGANGTLSDSDRADLSEEVSGIQSQLVSLANTSYQGQYIFAGTANTQPFVVDSQSASGVSYNGNQGTNSVAIGAGYSVQVNLPGSQVFSQPGADVFQAINDLINALNTNTNIGSTVSEVSDALNNVSAQQAFFGNALNQTQAQQTYLGTEKVDLSQEQNAISAADVSIVASQVSSDSTALNATLSAIADIPQNSLFDYLSKM